MPATRLATKLFRLEPSQTDSFLVNSKEGAYSLDRRLLDPLRA